MKSPAAPWAAAEVRMAWTAAWLSAGLLLVYALEAYRGQPWLFQGEYNDFHLRWQECRYVMAGVSPFDVLSGKTAPAANIGPIWGAGGSAPWAYAWGLFWTLPFLPYPAALAAARVLYPAGTVLLCGWVGIVLRRREGTAVGAAAALLLLSCPAAASSLQCGNYGFMVTVLVLLSVLYENDRPGLSVLLLAMAAVKPQVCGLFLLAKFLQKPLAALRSFAVGVLLPWALAAGRCQKTMADLLLPMWKQGTGVYSGTSHYGMFSALYRDGLWDRQKALFAAMLVGVTCVTLYCLRMRGAQREIYYCGAAFFTPLWFYLNDHDRAITFLLAAGVLAAARRPGKRKWGKWALLLLFLIFWNRPLIRMGLYPPFFDTGAAGIDLLRSNAETALAGILLISAACGPGIPKKERQIHEAK
jgi:hypothetical protein